MRCAPFQCVASSLCVAKPLQPSALQRNTPGQAPNGANTQTGQLEKREKGDTTIFGKWRRLGRRAPAPAARRAGSARRLRAGPPTDPYVPNSGIRLVRLRVRCATVVTHSSLEKLPKMSHLIVGPCFVSSAIRCRCVDTVIRFEAPAVFPFNGSLTRRPLPFPGSP